MQLIPRYLVKNKIDVVSNDIGFVVEYRPVYSRQLKVYRGIDNQFQFRLLNADQKPVTITGVPVIVVFDENNSKIIDKKCAVQDDGSSVQGRGMFNVTITENELLNIKEQYLKYNVYIEGDESNLITYADRNFGSV
jgi:translation elongation factor EF-G